MIPIIPLLSLFGIAAGSCTLYWYHNLSKSEQAKADRIAAEYAFELYEKGLDELTSHQLNHVQALVKRRFSN